MSATAHTYKLRKLTGVTLSINFKVTREFKLRLAVARFLITLASWVLGCGVDFDEGGMG